MNNKLTVKDSSIAFLSTIILCQFGTLFFATITLIIASFFNVSSSSFLAFLDTALGCLITSILMDGLIILIFFLFNKNKDNHILRKPTIKKIFKYTLISLICYLLLYPIVVTTTSLIAKFYPTRDLTYSLTTPNYLISIITIVILPAVAEELIFRGIIFKGLQKVNNTFAIIISSLMFALFHLSLEQTIYPILMGIVLAVIMCHENNIIYCILTHFLSNLISLTLKYLNISLAFTHWSYYIISAICFIIFITAAYFIIKKLNNSQQSNPINDKHKPYLFVCLGLVLIVWIVLQIAIIFKGLL